MNAKTLIIVSFCLLSFWAGELQANNPETTSIVQKNNDVPHGYEEIILQGSLVLCPGSNPIEAGVNDNSIYIQFNQNLGNVTVTVYNPSGLTIYRTHIEVLDYLDYEDPYGSPFLSNSRIFAKRSPQYEVDLNDIRYCFDSYLALGDLFKNPDEEIIDWTINTFHSSGGNFNVWQEPRIRYCAPVVLPGEDPITPPIH